MSCSINYIQATNLPEEEKTRLETIHVQIFREAKESKAFREIDNKLQTVKSKYADATSFVGKTNQKYPLPVTKLNSIGNGNSILSVNVLPLAEKQGELFFNLDSPQVNFLLKSVEILQSPKADEIFRKGDKNNWTLDKILQELQIPKEQQELVKSFNTRNREEILTSLLANYSYTIEINTATESKGNLNTGLWRNGKSFEYKGSKYEVKEINYTPRYYKDGQEITFDEIVDVEEEWLKEKQGITNTQYYSNLTVPGGTNYTENEITTPNITPSIKGHAQFATENGIGWFRSDDREEKIKKVPDSFITEGDVFTKENGKYYKTNTFFGTKKAISEKDYIYNYENEPSNIDDRNRATSIANKTRRILEVQSDWGQKQRKSAEPDINIKYDIQQIINDLQKSGELKIDCN